MCVPPDHRSERQAALRVAMEDAGLEALLVTHLANLRYLTGYSGSAGLLLVRPDRTTLITDFRYADQAPDEVGAAAVVEIERHNVWDRLGRVLAADGVGVLGIEAQTLTLRDAERLAAIARGRVVPTTDLVEMLRASKSVDEVASIGAAASLAAAALADTLPTVRVGQTELQVAAELESQLRLRGSEWHPFPTIVASGPRSALPHARTSGRTIQAGDWLLLDFGARVAGYCADLTRTVVVGARATERQRTVYELVRAAQRRALEHLRPGMSGRDADALARSVIEARGFGDAFGHSLGHGLGLEVHEAPRLAPTAEAALPMDAVVTVEPGIYLPGWGGVRLEDDVHLGPEGPVVLSDGRTELVELV